MNKKGLTWSTIVTAIIALIVLIFIVWIFREQIQGISKQFLSVIKQTGASADDFSKNVKGLIPEK